MFADFHGVSSPTVVISNHHCAVTECGSGKRCTQLAFMSQCKQAPAHNCWNPGAFSLWCVCREGPGLSPFYRVDGNHTVIWERKDMKKVMKERESV